MDDLEFDFEELFEKKDFEVYAKVVNGIYKGYIATRLFDYQIPIMHSKISEIGKSVIYDEKTNSFIENEQYVIEQELDELNKDVIRHNHYGLECANYEEKCARGKFLVERLREIKSQE
ncbi:MAG: hypothetical protein R3Y05_01350 [bacterium]